LFLIIEFAQLMTILATSATTAWLSVALLLLCVGYVVWSMMGKPGMKRELAESSHRVSIDHDVVTHQRPDGITEVLPFSSLLSFVIETNDLGPFATDCFWILVGQERDGQPQGCCIPQGATGDSALLERLQKLAGFDNTRFIEAMSSNECQKTVIWNRPTSVE